MSAEAPTRKALENEWDEKKDKKGNQSEKPEPIKQTGQIDPSIEVDPIKQNKPSAGVEQV